MRRIFALISLTFLFLPLFSCSPKSFKLQTSQEPGLLQDQVSEDFVQGSEDIPLLSSMEKIFDESLGFDSAEGSIMSSSYQTKTDLAQIKNFYLSTLPQMGWQLIETNETKAGFKRENERLEIEFINHDNKNVIRFFISSNP